MREKAAPRSWTRGCLLATIEQVADDSAREVAANSDSEECAVGHRRDNYACGETIIGRRGYGLCRLRGLAFGPICLSDRTPIVGPIRTLFHDFLLFSSRRAARVCIVQYHALLSIHCFTVGMCDFSVFSQKCIASLPTEFDGLGVIEITDT